MKLKSSLSLLDLFCIATGAMISSGLFILPGIAFSKAGPSLVVSYLLAAVLCIPALFSKAELVTAMPKAGGDYFYIMRGFGPLLGTIAGFSAWFSLSLKSVFALLGMGIFLGAITNMPINLIASLFCLFFIFLNLIGVKEAGRFQVFLVISLILILLGYIVFGMTRFNPANFTPFFSKGIGGTISTASFVFISYGGLTKIVALGEEAEDPGKNLPRAMIASLIVTSLLYVLIVSVTIGIINPDKLSTSLTPISDGGYILGGEPFRILLSIAAFLAFVSTANAGIMAASRYPLGMARDKLLPPFFQRVNKRFKTPHMAILFTGLFMILAVLILRLQVLVKVASSILILLFVTANAVLILFRESKLSSYKPKFRAPLYPYLQILGIIGGIFLLIEMGTYIVFLTGIFIFLGFLWYKTYVQKRVTRDSALIYLLEKLVAKDKELTSDNILVELKDVVLERDNVVKDKFHSLVEEAEVLDIEGPVKMEDFFKEVSLRLEKKLDLGVDYLFQKLVHREIESSTVIAKGLAIPHIVIKGEGVFRVLLARARAGIVFPNDDVVHAVFVLVASSEQRNLHLKVLSSIAQVVQEQDFFEKWLRARNEDELKNIILLAQRRNI